MTDEIPPATGSVVSALENILSVNRVAVKVPSFNAHDPELWFSMIEASFKSAGVVTDATKFGYVVGALDAKFAQEVRDIIVNPPATGQYEKLKTELVKRLATTQEQKTRRLLEHEEIGDRKPSQFLRHLRSLAGTVVPDKVIRTLWLGRLPQTMQGILATRKDDDLDATAELADAIADASPWQPGISAVSSTPADIDLATEFQKLSLSFQQELAAMRQEIAELRAPPRNTVRPNSRSQPRNRSSSRGRGHGKDGVCWYHWKFGPNATRCEKPCSHAAGNLTGGR